MASSMETSRHNYQFATAYLTTCDSFWSYELCKRWMMTQDESSHEAALKVLFCGGIAGIVTWGSVFPLDMIKTRLQAQMMHDHSLAGPSEGRSLLRPTRQTLNTFQIAREVYRAEGIQTFYRGLGVCSIRAFVVNAVQVRLPNPHISSKANYNSGRHTNGS